MLLIVNPNQNAKKHLYRDNEERLKEVVRLVRAEQAVLLFVLVAHRVEGAREEVEVHEVLVVVMALLVILENFCIQVGTYLDFVLLA